MLFRRGVRTKPGATALMRTPRGPSSRAAQATPWGNLQAPPTPGEHTEEILGELGFPPPPCARKRLA
jgi:crotonobetainyl-CoA:carnitine CoA-transferase CaiB-like acyl-CoA transferase